MIFENFLKNKTKVLNGRSLYDLATGNMRDKFPLNYFPSIQKTSTGIFICPRNKVISTNRRYFIKYLVIRNIGSIMKVVSDHNYPMVQLPQNGFIAKFEIDFTSIFNKEFTMEYFIDFNDVSISQNIEKTMVKEGNDQDSDFVEKQTEIYTFMDDPNKGFITELIQRSDFFDTYLSDAISPEDNVLSDIEYMNQYTRH